MASPVSGHEGLGQCSPPIPNAASSKDKSRDGLIQRGGIQLLHRKVGTFSLAYAHVALQATEMTYGVGLVHQIFAKDRRHLRPCSLMCIW